MCIKFGESVNDQEKNILNDLQIAWVQIKLNANFRNLQHDVIARLFKSHCCLFYGSQAWHIVHQIINAFVYHRTKVFETF